VEKGPLPIAAKLASQPTMKAYLVTTGILFGLFAVMHFLHSIAERTQLATDLWGYLGKSALGVVAAAHSVWAWWLLRLQGGPNFPPFQPLLPCHGRSHPEGALQHAPEQRCPQQWCEHS
jgi:hypothetical protein